MQRTDRNTFTRDQARQWHSGPTEEGQGTPSAETTADTQSIDLNHATWQQLMAVEGMDEIIAHTIVENRTHKGHFRVWEDLLRVPGVDEELMHHLQHAARIGGLESQYPPSEDSGARKKP